MSCDGGLVWCGYVGDEICVLYGFSFLFWCGVWLDCVGLYSVLVLDDCVVCGFCSGCGIGCVFVRLGLGDL